MLMLYFLVVLTSICIYFISKIRAARKKFFTEMAMDYIEPNWFGCTIDLLFQRQTQPNYTQMMYNKFPNAKLFCFYEFAQPIVMLRDPELIRQITVKDFEYFLDHSSVITEKEDRLVGNGLVMLKGKKWRDMRATLSPTFTGRKLRLMFDMTAECGDATIDFVMKQTENGSGKVSWEMEDFFMRYTNDVITTCAFGIKVNSFVNPGNEFLECGKEVLKFTGVKMMLKFVLAKVMPKLTKLFFTDVIGAKLYNFFSSMCLDTMRMREKENVYRPDMINILMQVQKEATKASDGVVMNEDGLPEKRTWTKDEIVAQCLVFYVGGFNTTSLALSFLAYELAINPDVQQILYNEIAKMDKKLDGKPIHYDDLNEMPYLNQIVLETLRKWAFGVIIERECVKDYVFDNIDGKTVAFKKGSHIWIPAYAIHHDPKYYPDPFKFDPSRFDEENKKKMLPETFFPFGMGPRKCIGSRFTYMQLKLITYKLILEFTLEPNRKTQIPIQLKKTPVGIAPERGIHLDIKRRLMGV